MERWPGGFQRLLTVIDTAGGELTDWAAGVEARAVEIQDDDRDGLPDILTAGFSAISRLSGR